MRKRNIFALLVLLLIAVSGAWATKTVTWKSSDLVGSGSITKDGVTYTGTFGNQSLQNGTFTTNLGKFTKIEMSAYMFQNFSGTGWSGSTKKTWQGIASNNVSFSGKALAVSSIVFTIDDAAVAVTGITLSETEVTLTMSEMLTLTAIVSPDDAANKTVTWESNDEAVATVGNDGTVTAVGLGTCTITVTATNGTADSSDDKTATCVVTVDNNFKTILTDGNVDADNWTLTPTEVATTGVEKSTPVSVMYNGRLKIKSMTATIDKKPAIVPTYHATTEDIGKVIGTDGNIYNNKNAATAAGTTAVAMIAYVGFVSDCNNGLAIALSDESSRMDWSYAITAESVKTPAVTGATWRLPSIKDWQYMLIGCGASGTVSDVPKNMSYSEFTSKLITAGGTALQADYYWSSSEIPNYGEMMQFTNNGTASCYGTDKTSNLLVRACLAF